MITQCPKTGRTCEVTGCDGCWKAEQAEQEPVHESLQIAAVALQDIACSSQTNNLLWWQIRAREAQKQIAERLTNSAPAEPVKQEPVASVRWGRYKECEWTATERLHELLGRYREGQTPLQLYAAPVRTKDLTKKWIDPNDKSQKQYLPHIGEKVLFCCDGEVYYGHHTGGSFQKGHGVTKSLFPTWDCMWMPLPTAVIAADREKNK